MVHEVQPFINNLCLLEIYSKELNPYVSEIFHLIIKTLSDVLSKKVNFFPSPTLLTPYFLILSPSEPLPTSCDKILPPSPFLVFFTFSALSYLLQDLISNILNPSYIGGGACCGHPPIIPKKFLIRPKMHFFGFFGYEPLGGGSAPPLF